jgi:hypothetical protein
VWVTGLHIDALRDDQRIGRLGARGGNQARGRSDDEQRGHAQRHDGTHHPAPPFGFAMWSIMALIHGVLEPASLRAGSRAGGG